MTRAALALALVASLAVPAGAAAQSLGLGRRLGEPRPEAPARPAADRPAEPPPEDDDAGWVGPQIQLGYDYFKLHDGYGGGDTHAASVAVFLQWPIPELRTALVAGLGGRDYTLGGDDLVVRGALEIGVQLPRVVDPVVPHVSLVLDVGGVVGQRFETTVAHAFGGAGIELGAALRLVRNLHLSAAFGYHRLEMDGAAHDVFILRLALGL